MGCRNKRGFVFSSLGWIAEKLLVLTGGGVSVAALGVAAAGVAVLGGAVVVVVGVRVGCVPLGVGVADGELCYCSQAR